MYLLNQKSSSSHHRPQPEAGLISHQQSRLVYWLSGLGLLALFLFFAWPYLLENWDSGRTDQMYYLDLGLDIRQGIRLTDGNRHPLFPLLLSTFARSEWAYFTSAKLLNVGLTLVTLALLLWLNSRLFGLSVALLSVGLTIFSVDFLEVQTKTIAEPLLTLLFTLVFYFWYRGRPRIVPGSSCWPERWPG
jgi:hypothetical protein